MATTKNTQTEAVPTVATSNSGTLTVVVLDDKNQPTAGARVSIQPQDATALTNNAGEVQFKLGSAAKYSITASYGSNTVEVPYYVTKNGATRLVVNPVYVKSIEAQLHPSSFFSTFLPAFGVVLAAALVLAVIWKILRRRKKKF